MNILSEDGRCLAKSQTKRLLITSLRRYQYTTLLDELSTDVLVPEIIILFIIIVLLSFSLVMLTGFPITFSVYLNISAACRKWYVYI